MGPQVLTDKQNWHDGLSGPYWQTKLKDGLSGPNWQTKLHDGASGPYWKIKQEDASSGPKWQEKTYGIWTPFTDKNINIKSILVSNMTFNLWWKEFCGRILLYLPGMSMDLYVAHE